MSDERKELDPESEEKPVGERDPRYGNLFGTQRDRSSRHIDDYLDPASGATEEPLTNADDVHDDHDSDDQNGSQR